MNKYQEALEIIDENAQGNVDARLYRKMHYTALKELADRATPMKPVKDGINPDKTIRYRCHNCGRLYWEESHIGKFCDQCGQSLKET